MTKLIPRTPFIDMYKKGGKYARNAEKVKGLEWLALTIFKKRISDLSETDKGKVDQLWKTMKSYYRKNDSFKNFNSTKNESSKEEVVPTKLKDIKEKVSEKEEVIPTRLEKLSVSEIDYNKDDLSKIYSSFGDAFADARRHYGKPSPENTFIWKGNKYGVYYNGEEPKKKEGDPTPEDEKLVVSPPLQLIQIKLPNPLPPIEEYPTPTFLRPKEVLRLLETVTFPGATSAGRDRAVITRATRGK